MSTAHTPGPWTFGHRGMDALWIGPSHEEEPVALVPWECDGARDTARQDARLAAASPDLLAALVDLLRHTNSLEVLGEWVAADVNHTSGRKLREQVDECIENARAAIARATGATP